MTAPKLKRKPSGIYFWEFADADTGGRRRVSTETRDEQKARAMGRDIVLGLAPQTAPMKSGKANGSVTMTDLFDRALKTVWAPSEAKAQRTILSNIKILTPLVGGEPIEAVTYTRLEKLVEDLRAAGYAPATIKRKMDMVSKALRMATKWTDDRGRPLLASKPTMPSIRVTNMKDRVLERHEEIAVLNAIEHRRQREPGRPWRRFAVLVRFLLDTGGRLGESLGVGPDAISVRQGQTYVTFARYRTKNDKPRTIPLTPAVVEGLGSIQQDVALRKGEWSYFPFTEGTAWYMWSNIREDVKAAGLNIDDVVLHTLRHTCLTRLAQGGMDLLRLQKWAGHSDPKITAERYTHLTPGDLTGGLDILSSNPTPPTIQGSAGRSSANPIFGEASANRAGQATPLLN